MVRLSSNSIRILHVDDGSGVAVEGTDERFEVDVVGTVADALDRLDDQPFDCVVSGHDLPDGDGVSLLEAVRETAPNLPILLVTDAGSEAVASRAISAGVTDYLRASETDGRPDLLADRIVAAVERWRVEDDYREICETIPYGVVVHDPEDGSLADVNGRFADLFGYDREELLAAGFEVVLPDESPHALADARRLVREVAEDGPRTVEWACVTRAGDRVWVEVHLTPIRLRGREVVLGVVREISERRERERELKAYETIVEAIDDAVYVLDRDGVVRYVNESYAEMKGVSKETLRDTPIDRWADEATVDRVRGMYREIERGERDVGKLEYEFRTADGEYVPAELRFSAVEFPDGERGRVGVVRDVRERTERERELERKNERLDEFASILSHDLRNPLNVLEGGLELAAESGDPAEFDRCRRAIDRMNQLVDDLLALARSDEETLAVAPLSLGPLVEQCWETVDTGEATLEVTAEGEILAAEGHLRRLFENLFRNAVEHGDPGSEAASADPAAVTITVGTLTDGFYVEDDGPGIPAAERERVFESGYSTAPGRTGLGLSIVKRVADAHGWAVAVTDAEGGGTRFEFTGVEPAQRTVDGTA